MNFIQKLFKSRKVDEPINSALDISAVMPSLSSLTDEHFYMYLEDGKIYLQHYHNPNMDDFFKDLKWFWNKDTAYIKRGVAEKIEGANCQYKNAKEWVSYCGGRNSGLWIPNWA